MCERALHRPHLRPDGVGHNIGNILDSLPSHIHRMPVKSMNQPNMTRTIHTLETAPEASRPMLEEVQQSFSMIPNLIGVMADAPAALEAYLNVAAAFAKSSLSPLEQQIVLLTTSVENQCTYCVAAHTTLAQMQKLPEDVVRAVRSQQSLADPKLEALRGLTQTLVRQRGRVPTDEMKAFLNAGYSRSQALEVITGVAQKTLSNYVNHLAGTPVDAPFQPNAWTPAETMESACACAS